MIKCDFKSGNCIVIRLVSDFIWLFNQAFNNLLKCRIQIEINIVVKINIIMTFTNIINRYLYKFT